jgi:Asp-tRNA(Asn)/Glu-tRNA(Gln) amidotransferase B subunit
MPEANLPPLRVINDPGSEESETVNVAKVEKNLEELPEMTRERIMKAFALRLETAIVIVVSLSYSSNTNTIDEKLWFSSEVY